MALVVEISDSVREGLRLSDGEAPTRLRCELALALYQQDLLAFGKAAELAGLSREDFATELGRRNIPRHYSEEDASLDATYAFGS
jgi:predicted HTH domain antitoxin